MSAENPTVPLDIRVLVVDDDPAVLESYRTVLDAHSSPAAELEQLRARLFSGNVGGTPVARGRAFEFTTTYVMSAEEAVVAVRVAREHGHPFEVVFLDMRMPPGHDGVWAAERIRAADRDVSIVFCTAFSDVDPAAVAQRVPPEEQLFYLQKPFHVHEVRQFAMALGFAWEVRRRARAA
jgi:CheY-like chemotaxis protein